MITKKEIIDELISNCDEETQVEMRHEKYHIVNDDSWTIADLFIRQWLNNGWDGFGMENVRKMYEYLCANKTELIEYNLVSPHGRNNSGFPLWNDYEFEYDL
jgi:hypothetical protein